MTGVYEAIGRTLEFPGGINDIVFLLWLWGRWGCGGVPWASPGRVEGLMGTVICRESGGKWERSMGRAGGGSAVGWKHSTGYRRVWPGKRVTWSNHRDPKPNELGGFLPIAENHKLPSFTISTNSITTGLWHYLLVLSITSRWLRAGANVLVFTVTFDEVIKMRLLKWIGEPFIWLKTTRSLLNNGEDCSGRTEHLCTVIFKTALPRLLGLTNFTVKRK